MTPRYGFVDGMAQVVWRVLERPWCELAARAFDFASGGCCAVPDPGPSQHGLPSAEATSWPTTQGSASPGGGLLIGILLALIVAANACTRMSKVALFWAAFVLTRPFGATFGDLLTKTPAQGGVGFGTVGSSAVLLALLLLLIRRQRRFAPA